MKKLINGIEYEMTEQEITELELSRQVIWSKENHIAELNEYHNQQFDQLWQQAGYLGAWEVVIASKNLELDYNDEAQDIMNYLWQGEQIINIYAETVTEQNAKTPQEVLIGLAPFDE